MSQDQDVLREVYEASYTRLVAQLSGVTGSRVEAEDVVQEAFVRAAARHRPLTGIDNPEAWLRTVAVNLARSRWRRAQRFLHLAPRLAAPDQAEDLATDSATLLAALRRLPDGQRAVVALHYLADLTVAEVAVLLGIPTGTVKARLHRARAALAVDLSETDLEVQEDFRA